MASRDPLVRRVDRQDEDLRVIADTVLDIQETVDQHTMELAAIKGMLADHDRRLDGIDGRLDGIDGRLDRIDDNQQQQGQQLAEILTLLRKQSQASSK
jgi:septal ring factor EnvC (AmiA/AmiB activator)